MKAPLFDQILAISQEISDASTAENDALRNEHCQKLQKLCATNQNSPNDHPLQWEALADFTEDGDQAIDIYQVGLHIANKLTLDQYSASIYLAMAMRYQEFEETEKTVEFAQQAHALIEAIDNDELKTEIIDFLQRLDV
jgi:regulator of replication initiation timing